jgi:very-short-patch-repair endonuclease
LKVSAAFKLADARSESALETRVRLVLVFAGLTPEVLQLNVFDRDGRWIARVDMAWPSKRLVVEADGREYHDRLEALHADRDKQNRIASAGWTVLRFTWFDVTTRPGYIVERVCTATRWCAGPPR